MSEKERECETNKGLSVLQLKAITLMSSGLSVEKTMEQIGKNPNTWYRWIKREGFSSALKDISQQIRDQAITELKNEVKNAVIVLKLLLHCESSPYLRRLVANDIIGYYFKDREFSQLEERLSRIEEKLKIKEV